MPMPFLKRFHDHVAATIHPSSVPPDLDRLPAVLPSIELPPSVSFRRLASAAPSDVISQTGLSAPAPMPAIDSAIPTDKPAPPPARFLAKRPSTPDVY
jgi:hypothetical protein